MTQFRYDTYCGLYCGACDIASAYKRGIENNSPPRWDDLPSPLRDTIHQAPIICHGCKTDTVFGGCGKCLIRKCARKKQGIESCVDCNKYPCLIHRITAIAKIIFRLEKRLPHMRIAPVNLQTIRRCGMASWLDEQRRRWACPDCGTSFTWYQHTCTRCGANLETIKDYMRQPVGTQISNDTRT
jgi:hypothetical protein